jgi:hypothetical protein
MRREAEAANAKLCGAARRKAYWWYSPLTGIADPLSSGLLPWKTVPD